MLLIAHRGNLNGPNPDRENRPDYIDEAIKKGFPVEVDLRRVDKQLYLGHDVVQYRVSVDWLLSRIDNLWIHCKNVEALKWLTFRGANFLWHKNDAYTITSKGYVWCYPGMPDAGWKSIAVLPEQVWALDTIPKLTGFYGICSDYVEQLDKEIE